MTHYDFLVVGSGLFGATFSYLAKKAGYSVLIVEKRSHVAGNLFTKKINSIHVHKYGAHIFHTNSKPVWDFITQFATFNRFINSPIANYRGSLYSLPFNMYTFNAMWGVTTPQEACDIINFQRRQAGISIPKNLEEQAISLVGIDIYNKLIKGYTEKQWGRQCKDLPASIIKRLPVRFTYDNNYFNALYQGIPTGGYTQMITNMIKDTKVLVNTNFLENRQQLSQLAGHIIYTGPIDAYFDYAFGPLEYRSVHFINELLDIPNYQGNAVINYTDKETPWTRIIEHKWFQFGKDDDGNDLDKTVISKEFPSEWVPGAEPYYPINDCKNNNLYQQYKALSQSEPKVTFGGRLGEYKYYDMDTTIESAFQLAHNLL